MFLDKFFEEVLRQGQKVQKKIIEEVIASPVVGKILKNETFLNTVRGLVQVQSEVNKTLQEFSHRFLKGLTIPTQDELQSMERKVHHLEREVQTVNRRLLSQKLKKVAKVAKAKRQPKLKRSK